MISSNGSFKKRSVKFVFSYFFTFGLTSYLVMLLAAVGGTKMYAFLPTLAVTLILPNVLAAFLFYKNDEDVKMRWSKRILYMTCTVLETGLVFILFRHYDSIAKVLAGFGLMILVNLLIGVPLWILADRRDRKNIDKINQKLQENTEE